jgi:hypothetical protein
LDLLDMSEQLGATNGRAVEGIHRGGKDLRLTSEGELLLYLKEVSSKVHPGEVLKSEEPVGEHNRVGARRRSTAST